MSRRTETTCNICGKIEYEFEPKGWFEIKLFGAFFTETVQVHVCGIQCLQKVPAKSDELKKIKAKNAV